MTTYLRITGYAAAGLLLLGFDVGCHKSNSRPVFPVRGQFVFQGRPLAGAFVVFHPLDGSEPLTVEPRAHTGQDGRFVLTTYATGDGAPAGEYAVTVQWPEERPGEEDRG